MTRARDIANLVDSNGDIVAGALDNVPASNDASALTTGTLAAARLPSSGISASALSTGTLDAARLPSSGISASALTTGTLPDGVLSAGSVLQVVSAYDQSTYNLSTSGYFGPSVTITPSSTSSKLLILVMYSAGNSNTNGGVKILQNGGDFMPNLTNAYQGGAASYNGAFNTGDDSWGASAAYMIRPVHVQYLHSPNSTSALTYRGYWYNATSGNLRLNRQETDNGGRAFSHMTVMEIAG